MARRRQARPSVPVVITELTKLLDGPDPNYDELIFVATEIVIARIPYREHHLQALVVIGRCHLARNMGDDLKLAVRRLEQAYDLACEIGVPELVFRAGCRYAEALARTGQLELARELMTTMEVRFLKDDPRGARRKFYDARFSVVEACSIAA